jgi:cytochrome c biogenesis protein CcmG/thiol:disulfide interchange protein DsbE
MLTRQNILLVCAAVAVVALALTEPIKAADIRPAPNVTLQDAQGATVRLADYKGKVVLIDFWASWCIPCRTSFPALDALYREYQPRGLEVLAVNLDERRRDADTFLATRPHTMPVLFDARGASPLAFAVRGMPSSFLIDRAGHIRFTHMGYSDNIGEQYRREIAQLIAERQPGTARDPEPGTKDRP